MMVTCVLCHNDFEYEETDMGMCEECIDRIKSKVGLIEDEEPTMSRKKQHYDSPIADW